MVDNILEKLFEMELGQGVSKPRDAMMNADDIYNKDCKDLEELKARYEELEISIKVRKVKNDSIFNVNEFIIIAPQTSVL